MSAPRFRARTLRGFTLIECLTTLVLLAIFAALAAPGLAAQIRKARRADAISSLLLLEQAQARWRATHPTYANDLRALGPVATMDVLSQRTASGRYDVRIEHAHANGYLLIASAVADQQGDAPCQVLAVRVIDRSTRYLAGTTRRLEHSPALSRQCWKQ